MASQDKPLSIDEYIGQYPPETRAMLQDIRALVHEVAPEASETISYAIPTFDLNGKHLIHFAAWKDHISVYPVPGGDAPFASRMEAYQTGKGTAQFPLTEPVPMDLIRLLVEYRLEQLVRDTAS